jgi:hypothetical protein
MANKAVVDNDILLKCACYRLLGEVLDYFGGPGSIGILGAARFVVRSYIQLEQDYSRHWLRTASSILFP